MVFCNTKPRNYRWKHNTSHNPYFNRWFSAIDKTDIAYKIRSTGHNPYFNRWFSAIAERTELKTIRKGVTILILIDGFLQ